MYWKNALIIDEYEIIDKEEMIEEEKDNILKKLDVKLNPNDENKINNYSANNLELDLAYKINAIIDKLSEMEK
jgi:hypothetical protein